MQKVKKLFYLFLALFLVFMGYKIYQAHKAVKHVMTYRPLVREVLEETGVEADENLVLAMIYTETKGREDDVMQSSESVSGLTNTITDSKESIRRGVEVLAKNMTYADTLDVDIWTAVQAYNFGSNYMDYVAKNGGHNTIALARTYSREVVAPSLGNTDGETYTYFHPLALLDGGQLYVNGGNIYYSRQVRFNMYLIRFLDRF